MDALSLLNKKIDVIKVLEHYDFDNIHPDGDFIRSSCKLHGGNNPSAFVASLETGLWYCHTGDCGGGDIYTLVQVMEECDFPTAVKWVANFFDVDINNMQITERKDAHVKEMKNWIKTIKSRRKKSMPEYHIDVETKKVAEFRDFKPETIDYFSLLYVDEIELERKSGGTYTLYKRLVFPIIQNGVQIGASLRRIRGRDVPKWSHQPLSIETSELLYNYDNTANQKEVVIVEGIPDVWAFHEIGIVAVATFGAHVTLSQYKQLMRTGADLIFAYDGDSAGRSATQKALSMFRYKANLFYLEFEEGEDPESITREELKERYESRRKG